MRLSIIIPGYNTDDTLWSRSISSVLAACGTDDEVICVNDASAIQPSLPWINCDSRVKWLHREKNGGLSAARNSGLEIAQGEYVTFVDSDDEVKTETFSRCLEKLRETNDDICLYGVDVIWQKDGIRKHDIPEDANYGVMDAATVEKLYYGCLFNYSCNKVYRKAFLDDNHLRFNPDGMPCEDIVFNLNCLMAGAKWCSVAYEGYVYYRSGLTQTSNYLPSYAKGTKLSADTWAKYCQMDSEANCRFQSLATLEDDKLLWLTWDNLWWRKSPFSLAGRYVWLDAHADMMGIICIPVEFLKKLLYYSLRYLLYAKTVRIWHLKRIFHNIETI